MAETPTDPESSGIDLSLDDEGDISPEWRREILRRLESPSGKTFSIEEFMEEFGITEADLEQSSASNENS